MKRTLFAFVFLGFTSCNLFDSENQVAITSDLDFLYEEIQQLAESKPCIDPNDWDFVALGSKPCGGPWEYIAYPKSIIFPNF
ncbi:hypothetical protein [Algoriphagus limi]|uniref:Uncharacterized protein n=1 Tax=Algoriphagus limi TaxID=2975273 RepID=A0ABT2G9G0_9BACT|nr:hypothetical protein [Algoriphagus limi]MCS5491889.1 hypothetical protein [Algoriphagus limi]